MFKTAAYAATLFSLTASAAFAAGAGGGGALPWGAPLQTLSADLTGPTAYAITLLGIFGIFAVLIFGGEINHWVRSMAFVVCGGATLVGSALLFTGLGVAGAEIDNGNGLWSLQRVLLSSLAAALAVYACQWLWRRWHARQYFIYACTSFMRGSTNIKP